MEPCRLLRLAYPAGDGEQILSPAVLTGEIWEQEG